MRKDVPTDPGCGDVLARPESAWSSFSACVICKSESLQTPESSGLRWSMTMRSKKAQPSIHNHLPFHGIASSHEVLRIEAAA